MRILCLGLALGLSACATPHLPNINTSNGPIVVNGQSVGEAPAPKVPNLPENLAKKAGSLPPLRDGHASTVNTDLATTSSLYNDVAHQLNDVIDAWDCVKVALNDKVDAAKCFKGK